ncbi:hypothetical protein HDU81_002590 [Chytriomyces hyalinus]|nr:hypothetical protein HDU81_002590 [Chytriomyces hyalinus]
MRDRLAELQKNGNNLDEVPAEPPHTLGSIDTPIILSSKPNFPFKRASVKGWDPLNSSATLFDADGTTPTTSTGPLSLTTPTNTPMIVTTSDPAAVETPARDETGRILALVESTSQTVASLQCQTVRLRATLNEFDEHGEGEDVELLRPVIEEKFDILKEGIKNVKVLISGLALKPVSFGRPEGLVQLAAFHRRRLTMDVTRVEVELEKVFRTGERVLLAGGVSKSADAAGFGKLRPSCSQDFITITPGRADSRKGSKLQDLIEARTKLDVHQEKEKELQRIEGGLTELVHLYGNMREVIDTQDIKMDAIVTSLDTTCVEVDTAVTHVAMAVQSRKKSRKTCWIMSAWIVGVVVLGIVAVVLYFVVFSKIWPGPQGGLRDATDNRRASERRVLHSKQPTHMDNSKVRCGRVRVKGLPVAQVLVPHRPNVNLSASIQSPPPAARMQPRCLSPLPSDESWPRVSLSLDMEKCTVVIESLSAANQFEEGASNSHTPDTFKNNNNTPRCLSPPRHLQPKYVLSPTCVHLTTTTAASGAAMHTLIVHHNNSSSPLLIRHHVVQKMDAWLDAFAKALASARCADPSAHSLPPSHTHDSIEKANLHSSASNFPARVVSLEQENSELTARLKLVVEDLEYSRLLVKHLYGKIEGLRRELEAAAQASATPAADAAAEMKLKEALSEQERRHQNSEDSLKREFEDRETRMNEFYQHRQQALDQQVSDLTNEVQSLRKAARLTYTFDEVQNRIEEALLNREEDLEQERKGKTKAETEKGNDQSTSGAPFYEFPPRVKSEKEAPKHQENSRPEPRKENPELGAQRLSGLFRKDAALGSTSPTSAAPPILEERQPFSQQSETLNCGLQLGHVQFGQEPANQGYNGSGHLLPHSQKISAKGASKGCSEIQDVFVHASLNVDRIVKKRPQNPDLRRRSKADEEASFEPFIKKGEPRDGNEVAQSCWKEDVLDDLMDSNYGDLLFPDRDVSAENLDSSLLETQDDERHNRGVWHDSDIESGFSFDVDW